MPMITDCRDCPAFKTGIFAGLTVEERENAICIMQRREYKKRRPIFEEGESSHRVFTIRSGLVKVYKNVRGKRAQVLNIHGPGELLGIEAIMDSRYRTSAEALTKCEICDCTGEDFKSILKNKPSVSIRVIDLLYKDMTKVHYFLCNIGTKKAYSRMACALLFFHSKMEAKLSPSSFNLPVMRHELSELIGVSAETISRQLKRMVGERVIKLENKKVTVIDQERLLEIANED